MNYKMNNQLSLTRNAANAATLLTFLGSNPALRGQILGAAKGVANQVGSYFNPSPSPLTFPISRTTRGASTRLLPPNRRSSKGKRKKGRRQSSNASNTISRPVAYLEPRMSFKMLYPLTTATTTGIFSGNIWMGYKNTVNTASLSSISTTQYTALASIFNYQTCHSICVTYIPSTPYTSSGLQSICINEDPTLQGNSGTIQYVDEHRVSNTGDVKERFSICWRPTDEQGRESKEANDASAVTGGLLRNFAPCSILTYGTTNLTSGATTYGYLEIIIDLTFTAIV